jgi:hypothetical protein
MVLPSAEGQARRRAAPGSGLSRKPSPRSARRRQADQSLFGNEENDQPGVAVDGEYIHRGNRAANTSGGATS